MSKAPPTAQQRAEYAALVRARPEVGWHRISYRVEWDRSGAAAAGSEGSQECRRGIAVAPPGIAASALGAAAPSQDVEQLTALSAELGFVLVHSGHLAPLDPHVRHALQPSYYPNSTCIRGVLICAPSG